VESPAAVLGLVLVELGVGAIVLMWVAPTWNAVRHGFEILVGSTAALATLGAWAALRGPLRPLADGSARLALALTLATALLAAASVAALLARRPPLGRVIGLASAATGVAALVPLGLLRASTGVGAPVVGIIELATGAFFLGAVWDGMLLGHWYLVEKRLSNRYMVWMAWVTVGAVVAGLVSVLLSATDPAPCAGLTQAAGEACRLTYSPILSVGSLTVIFGAGLVTLVGMTAGFNVKLAREGGRSIQAATGMAYLAVIMAPAAEFAAKLRYY